MDEINVMEIEVVHQTKNGKDIRKNYTRELLNKIIQNGRNDYTAS